MIKNFTWTRTTKTLDSLGRTASSSAITTSLTVQVTPISENDLFVSEMGNEIRGSFIVYCEADFTVSGTDYNLEPNDMLTDSDGKKYLIKEVESAIGREFRIFRKCIVRSVENG